MCRCSCSPPRAIRWTASSASNWAPTTTCPNPSSLANCWRGCAPCCAGARTQGERSGARAQAVSEQVAAAITGYIADRFEEPQAGLTLDRIEALLQSHGAGGSVHDLRRLLVDLDVLRFTPAAQDPARLKLLIRDARARLTQLDRAIVRRFTKHPEQFVVD